MTQTTISKNGELIIPEEILDQFGLKVGDSIHLIVSDGAITIVPIPNDPIKEGAGMFEGDPSLTEAIVEEHKKEAKE